MTDKHVAEHSNTACLGVDWHVCDVYIAHTTIKPEVSIFLTEMPFLFLYVNFYTSKNSLIQRTLKLSKIIVNLLLSDLHRMSVCVLFFL